jgi:Na+:H+ antiporter, NhaA family
MGIKKIQNHIVSFVQLEIFPGILLLLATICALIATNVPLLADYYNNFLNFPLEFRSGGFAISKTLLLWINDGLMAIFFLVVALEIKREALTGKLTNISYVLLPAIAAIGGMLVPVMIYIYINQGNDMALQGWAIPAATDIAFALGVLTLLGKRVPLSLKLFLLTLAILDDLGAILIIAVFYNHGLSVNYLLSSGVVLSILVLCNIFHIKNLSVYLLLGVILWAFVLKSGIHATIAGVLVALTIPRIHNNNIEFDDSIEFIENKLQLWVSYCILPLFAFSNAGIPFAGMSLDILLTPVTLGIMLGLVIGKQVGVFLFSYLSVKLGIVSLPHDIKLPHLYGVSILCGIGFTMSLFIGILSFGNSELVVNTRVGVLLGSVISAVIGYLVLKRVLPK